MPTIEFHGYPQSAIAALIPSLKTALGDLPYREDIVFVHGATSRVVAWNGSERPFVRVLTRKAERAVEIRDRINHEYDVETVLIGFTPRTSPLDGDALPTE